MVIEGEVVVGGVLLVAAGPLQATKVASKATDMVKDKSHFLFENKAIPPSMFYGQKGREGKGRGRDI